MYIACSVSYYLINFYVKYMKGDIYTNQITNSLSEAAANLLPLIMIKYMSVSRGLTLSFLVSSVACGIVMFGSMNDAESLIPLGVIGVKGGVSLGFSFLYFSSINFFEN